MGGGSGRRKSSQTPKQISDLGDKLMVMPLNDRVNKGCGRRNWLMRIKKDVKFSCGLVEFCVLLRSSNKGIQHHASWCGCLTTWPQILWHFSMTVGENPVVVKRLVNLC